MQNKISLDRKDISVIVKLGHEYNKLITELACIDDRLERRNELGHITLSLFDDGLTTESRKQQLKNFEVLIDDEILVIIRDKVIKDIKNIEDEIGKYGISIESPSPTISYRNDCRLCRSCAICIEALQLPYRYCCAMECHEHTFCEGCEKGLGLKTLKYKDYESNIITRYNETGLYELTAKGPIGPIKVYARDKVTLYLNFKAEIDKQESVSGN